MRPLSSPSMRQARPRGSSVTDVHKGCTLDPGDALCSHSSPASLALVAPHPGSHCGWQLAPTHGKFFRRHAAHLSSTYSVLSFALPSTTIFGRSSYVPPVHATLPFHMDLFWDERSRSGTWCTSFDGLRWLQSLPSFSGHWRSSPRSSFACKGDNAGFQSLGSWTASLRETARAIVLACTINYCGLLDLSNEERRGRHSASCALGSLPTYPAASHGSQPPSISYFAPMTAFVLPV